MKKNNNQGGSFFHQPTPKRVAPRLGGHQKNRGTTNLRKGTR